MTHTTEATLQKSLQSVDRYRRLVSLSTAFYWLLTLGTLLQLVYISRTSDNLERLLLTSVAVLAFCTCLGMFAVMMHVTRMTRKILQAIELVARELPTRASMPPESPK